MTHDDCDVLVIGLGPAGAAAALSAAERGLAVIAIDRKRRVGEPVQCAELVPMPLLARTRTPGVLVQKVDGMSTTLPSGTVEASSVGGLMVDRARFDEAIAASAAAAGARLLLDTRLERLDARASVALVSSSCETRSLRYRLLVAGDGPHSRVARLLALAPLELMHTRQYAVDLSEARRHTEIYLSDRYRGGYAWLFPKGRVANLGLGFSAPGATGLKSLLDRLHARLANEGRIGHSVLTRTGGAIPVGGLRSELVVGNVVFAGDAAGLAHPISGAGIAPAVVSGEHAGEVAAAFLAGRASALDDYAEAMRDLFESTHARALARRRELETHVNDPSPVADARYRRGWIAFPEYYHH